MKEYIVHVPKHLETNQEEIVSFFGEPIIELIRCKGCKFYGVCVLSNAEDGFCAWAEPKETE